MSPLVWGAWIEILKMTIKVFHQRSPLVWGAWIEMCWGFYGDSAKEVAPRMGGVD